MEFWSSAGNSVVPADVTVAATRFADTAGVAANAANGVLGRIFKLRVS
jgi:hypothetical protein